MSRLKLLVAAALLGLPLAACEEGTKPPPVGQIDGQVVIEGEGIDGVAVSLSSGVATTTSGGGYYSFADVEGGTYTITISGLPADASFDATSAEVTIAQSGQTVNRNFNGSWIRTASLMGMVTVEGEGLPGITVSVSGRQEAQMVTDDNGQYTFTGLRAGNYTIEISGFDATDVGFAATSSAVEVAVGESKVWSFEGTYVRESVIAGQVSVAGNGLAGVTVSLQGMGEDDDENTDVGGQFTFSNLRAGEYQLAISGFDAREYGFTTTSATVRVEHGRTANVPFEGILLRTATIMGQVTIEGEGLADVTVSLSGEGENLTTMTNTAGQYAFNDLPAGNFQVGISGYRTDDYSFETTSRNVALALGETATVPFEGILLRTSGISGRVSVEGTGLDNVTVTLSHDDMDEDRTTMTDMTGQYAFSGLAEGDGYTVAISDYDTEAYIFDEMSKDVDLGDDDTQIVNFMGEHARTAMVSGMVFIDEAADNDSYDEGEDALAAAGIVLALVGPGILDQTPGTTGADGSFAFPNLRAGPYQLVVVNSAAAGPDYAYGGPAEGYAITLDVGDEETQNIPFDITHQTVNFMVNLKHGAKMGAALPGATVSFFSDLGGTRKIGDADPGTVDGTYSIRFARSAASNNTVYASVAAPAGSYDTSGAMQAVTWDARYAMSTASNEADIVNTMANFSFSGATVMTDMGGGKALGEWKVSVTSGDEAVAGAPKELGANGSASVTETVAAGDLPKSYTIEMAGWEDQANDSTGDGGERYTSTTLTHSHDGLSLAGTSTEAGTLVVTYTTQTLKVYVHQERDQVEGFTGNVLGGDERMSGIVDVSLRYIDGSGRSRAFLPEDSVRKGSGGAGVTVWRNVPADHDVIVRASLNEDAENVMLLDNVGRHQDEFLAYQDRDANGIVGGAFGAEGGFHHTVELCPLVSLEDHQRHGECGTFAFIDTHHVFGQVWEWGHAKSGAGFATNRSKMGVPGTRLSLEPVEGENLAGDPESYTALEEDDRDTRGVDDRLEFDWGRIAEGVYELEVPRGWRARVGAPADAAGNAADSVSPLQADLHIDLTPTTGYVYGVVTDAATGEPLKDIDVNVNGVTATSDASGRYVARGFSARNIRRAGENFTRRNRTQISTREAGATATTRDFPFAANSPRRYDIAINKAKITKVSGRVTKSGTGVGVSGVEILFDGRAPLNAREYRHPTNRFLTVKRLLTDGNGNYSADISATGDVVEVTAVRRGMFFTPNSHTVTAAENAEIDGINFTAIDNVSVSGRVVDSDNAAVSGVKVKATPTSGPSASVDSAYSSATGHYTLSLPYGQYSVAATRNGYTFTPTTQSINVPGTASIEHFVIATVDRTNATLSALDLSGVTLCRTAACGTRDRGFRSSVTNYTATVGNSTTMTTVSAMASVDGADVSFFPDDADSFEPGHQVALEMGNNTIEVTVTALDNETEQRYTVVVDRRNESTMITGTITDVVSGNGVSGVWLRVSGTTLLNGFTSRNVRYVSTGSDGMYEAEVESTGGSVLVIPVSNTRSFTPTSQEVTATANSTISAIDFKSAQHGTIMGTVTDGTNPLEGVTVTATNGSSVRTGTTTRQGTFTITRVPTGIVTITAAKTGYMFPSQNVHLGPGATVAIGTIEGSSSADVSLSSVTVNGETVDADDDDNYSTEVANDIAMATIVATPTDNGEGGATVAYSGTTDADPATDGHQVALTAGVASVTTVTVTAAAGNSASYTVTVTRMSSADVSLSSLTVNGDEVDADTDGNYATTVTNDIATATIEATAAASGATVAYTGTTDADDAMAGHQVELTAGEASATTVTVTASDAAATPAVHTVTITRDQAVVRLSAAPNPVAEGGTATITGTVDVAQAEEFTVTVAIPADAAGTLSTNAVLTFAADDRTSTGTVTVEATDDDIRNDPAVTIAVSGTSSDATMMVEGAPLAVTDDEMVASAPRNLRVSMPGTVGQVAVAWDSPSQIGTATIDSYEWEATATGRGGRSGALTTLTGDSLFVTVGDGSNNNAALELGVEYTFTVHAVTSIGDGEEASTAVKALPTVTLAYGDGSTSPIAENAADSDTDTDSVFVKASLDAASAEDVTVTVTVSDDELAEVFDAVITITAGNTTSEDSAYVKAIDNATDEATDNTVTISAEADNANDPATALDLTITDDDEAPTAAPALTVGSPQSGSLLLSWTFDATTWGTGDEDTREFQYRIKKTSEISTTPFTDDDWTDVPDSDGDTRSYRPTGLDAEQYTVEVRAWTEAGGSPASSSATGTPGSE